MWVWTEIPRERERDSTVNEGERRVFLRKNTLQDYSFHLCKLLIHSTKVTGTCDTKIRIGILLVLSVKPKSS